MFDPELEENDSPFLLNIKYIQEEDSEIGRGKYAVEIYSKSKESLNEYVSLTLDKLGIRESLLTESTDNNYPDPESFGTSKNEFMKAVQTSGWVHRNTLFDSRATVFANNLDKWSNVIKEHTWGDPSNLCRYVDYRDRPDPLLICERRIGPESKLSIDVLARDKQQLNEFMSHVNRSIAEMIERMMRAKRNQ